MTEATHFIVRWTQNNDGAQISVGPEGVQNTFDTKSAERESVFRSIFGDFSKSMLGYIELLPIAAYLYPVISRDLFQTARDFVEKNATDIIKDGDAEVFRVPIQFYKEFRHVSRGMEALEHVGNQVPKMLLMGIISSFEYHMSILLRSVLEKFPKIVADARKQVDISEVLEADSFEDFRRHLVDDIVDETMRQSFDEQVKWFEGRLKLDSISGVYKDWSSLVEILERRNLFAHTNGVVSEIYLRNATKFGFVDPGVKKGQELFVSPTYLRQSTETVVLFLTMLIHVVWRKVDQGDEGYSNDALGGFGFDLIERGEFSLASKVLEFASTLRGKKSNERRLMDLVNLANAYKLQDRLDDCKKVLDGEDWSAVGDKFLVSVAAIRGDISSCIDAMERIGTSGSVEPSDYEQWPVFFNIRDQDSFKTKFEEVFGRPFVPSPRDAKTILTSLVRGQESRQKKKGVNKSVEAGGAMLSMEVQDPPKAKRTAKNVSKNGPKAVKKPARKVH